MTFLIREFDNSEADYAALARIWNAVHPTQPEAVTDLRHRDDSRPVDNLHKRLMAEWAQEPVGYVFAGQSLFSKDPRRVIVSANVLPERRGRGIGSALYEAAIEWLASLDVLEIHTMVRESDAIAIRFAEKRGFAESMREWRSALDIAAYDPARFEHLTAKAIEAGITVKSVKQLQQEGHPDWDHKIHTTEMSTLADVPMPEPFKPLHFERWQKIVLQSPSFLPEAFLVALDGDRFVGTTALWRSAGEDTLETGLTGVLREYRRKGIAITLKLHALRYAKESGAATVRTENATTNRPMLAINEMLGFEKEPAEIHMVKQISGNDE